MPDPAVERVGVILVHGIGERRRFQHLDWQLRNLIRALDGLEKQHLVTQVSVDISSSGAAAFQAEQDSWTAGPRASVRHRGSPLRTWHAAGNEAAGPRSLVG